MATNGNNSLELALSQTEEDADAACKAATTALRAMKKFRAAAQAGNLRELRRAIETAGQTIAELEQQFTKAKTGWCFEEETYLSDGSFVAEVLATAADAGVHVYERDERLYCYPSLIRVLPNDRSVVESGNWQSSGRPQSSLRTSLSRERVYLYLRKHDRRTNRTNTAAKTGTL